MRPVIYLITNIVNGKTYVGITKKTVEQRWRLHVYTAMSKPKSWLHRAIAKYGKEAFTAIQIASCLDVEHAAEVEKIGAKNRGQRRTAEQRAANAEQAKARYANDPAFRARMAEHLGRVRAMIDHDKRKAAARDAVKSRVWTDESRAKLSASCMGRRYSQEVIAKVAEAKKRPVVCTTLNAAFDSVSDAAEACGISISGVSSVCLGKRKRVYGLEFRFA